MSGWRWRSFYNSTTTQVGVKIFTSCVSKVYSIFLWRSTALSHARAMPTSWFHHTLTSTLHLCHPRVMRPRSDAISAVFTGLLCLSGWHQHSFASLKMVSQPLLSAWQRGGRGKAEDEEEEEQLRCKYVCPLEMLSSSVRLNTGCFSLHPHFEFRSILII